MRKAGINIPVKPRILCTQACTVPKTDSACGGTHTILLHQKRGVYYVTRADSKGGAF